MCAKNVDEMSNAALQARQWANELVRRESRGPGDVDNAMRRLEARYGIPASTLWRLRYRTPTDIFVSVFLKINAAYQAECERQLRLLEHDLAITKAKAGDFHPAVRAAEALAGKEIEQ